MNIALRALVVAVVVTTLAAPAFGQQPFASRVIAFDTRGGAGGGIFDPTRALGPPAGSTDVHSLGVGGFLTLGFDVTITDGPGADLIVTENPFPSATAPWMTFCEVVFVEVSSDGVHFVRIPTRYVGPQVDPGPFAFAHTGWYAGFSGVYPAQLRTPYPQDVTFAGGDAIDLADARNDPLVRSGAVDLQRITQVRLVDVRSGVDRDANGVVIRDPGGGSADIDAITVIHHLQNQSRDAPHVDLDVPSSGNFVVTISDPQGLGDLDPTRLGLDVFGITADPTILFSLPVVALTPTSITVTLGAPLPPGFPLSIAVSVADRAGHRSGASRTRT